MQQTLWARGCRLAIEACWLLVFAVVPVFFSVNVFINFIHDKIPLFRTLVELGALAAILGALTAGVRPALRLAQGRGGDKETRRQGDRETGRQAPEHLATSPPHHLTTPLLLAVGAYAVVVALATVFGRNPAGSWWGDYPRIFGSFTLLHGVLLFLLMAGYLTTPAQRQRWTLAALAAAAMVSLYAIAQRLGWDPYQWSGPIGTQARPVASIGNASALGAYLVFVIPLTLGAMVGARTRLLRCALGGLALLQIVAVGLTLTRGAWLGTGALLVLFGLLLTWRRGQKRLGQAALAVAVLAALALVAINVRPRLVAGVSNRYVQRLANLMETAPGSSGWERLQGWKIALEAARGPALLLGHGPQSYVWVASSHYRPYRTNYEAVGQLLESAHNCFMDTLVETGLLGLLALLAMLGVGFATGLRALRRAQTPLDEGLLIAALSALAGYAVQGLFCWDHLMTLLFVMGFLAIIVSIAASDQRPTTNDERPTTNDQRRTRTAGREPVRVPSSLVVGRWSFVGALAATAAIGWCIVVLNVNDFRADIAKADGVVAGPQGDGDLDTAEASFRAAARLCPWQPVYATDLAGICAARAAAAAPARPPLTNDCRDWLVEAERHLRSAIAREPADYRNHLQLGRIYRFWAAYDPTYLTKGLRIYADAVLATPGRQSVYWEWGDYCLDLGVAPTAINCYRLAVDLDPDVIPSRRKLAELYTRMSRVREAEREYESAWALEARDRKIDGPIGAAMIARRALEHEILGQAFLAVGDTPRAVRHLRETLALDAADEKAKSLLAQIGAGATARGRAEG